MRTWKPKDIKDLRNSLGLTQSAFAEMIGVTQNYVHMLEVGLRIPSKTLMILLAYIGDRPKRGKRP